MVGIIDDSVALEGDEVFIINIGTPLPPGITVVNGASQVTILDDDGKYDNIITRFLRITFN